MGKSVEFVLEGTTNDQVKNLAIIGTKQLVQVSLLKRIYS